MITEITSKISAVGHIDWSVRDFHGYDTARGTTYNSYLLRYEKSALIDTVKDAFAGNLSRKLTSVGINGKLDYIIVNHAEPDHSGALPHIVAMNPQAVVVCNQKCRDILGAYYNIEGWNFQIVKTGDTISLGEKCTLQFVEIPMVHWPDSMVTYLVEEQILFSNDAFGEHLASSSRFDDGNSLFTLIEEAKSYYANIVNPYSKRVVQVLETLKNIPLQIICPSHGVIWRKELAEIMKGYRNWANQRVRAKVVVLYDTMWGRTSKMVEAITEGVLSVPGVTCKVLPVRGVTLNRIATEALDAACFALGSSTLNQQMMPQMASAICYLQGLNFPGKAAFSFGSRGWGKGGPELLDAKIAELRWESIHAPVLAKFEPEAAVLDECRAAGAALAAKALELAAASGYEPLCID
ncbi:MAG: FprA family A-type flavoprotein [Victivallales bacterium]|nr:FprA family A-type flavoprotein [Victivallales bacterium]